MSQNTQLVFDVTSTEEALKLASEQWNVSSDDLVAEVVGEEKSFFGLFGKKLKVQVSPRRPLLLLRSCAFLAELLDLMDLQAVPEFLEDEYMIGIEGRDAEILVGRYGDGLRAMEYLLNLSLRSPGEEPRVRLNSGGYRERRMQSLERLAEATARKVADEGTPFRLEPMASWERWVIHMTLKDREDVETQSVGEAPDRKVVVLPKLGAAQRQESYRSGSGRGGRPRYRR